MIENENNSNINTIGQPQNVQNNNINTIGLPENIGNSNINGVDKAEQYINEKIKELETQNNNYDNEIANKLEIIKKLKNKVRVENPEGFLDWLQFGPIRQLVGKITGNKENLEKEQFLLEELQNKRASNIKNLEDWKNQITKYRADRENIKNKYVKEMDALKKIGIESPFYIAKNMAGLQNSYSLGQINTQEINAPTSKLDKDVKRDYDPIKDIVAILGIISKFMKK